MNRWNKDLARSRMYFLMLLILVTFLTSCGSDGPGAPVDTNDAPTVPAIDTTSGAPAHAATGVGLDTDLAWTCSDPDDDDLTYTIKFGTTAQPPIVAQDQVPRSYTPTGLVNGMTYYWQIMASDGSKSTNSPVWSFTTAAVVAELVTSPDAPTGPAADEVDAVLSYTVTGGSSSESHALEYQFDWDDGTSSVWTSTMPVTHAWTLAGTYDVTALARCIAHPSAVSSNSVALQVTIDGPENVTAPAEPAGPPDPMIDIAVSYAIYGASNSRSHTLEYRVDWGDGTFSDWGPGGTTNRTWTVLGDYNVRAQARCQDHPDLESPWSSNLAVTVLGPETVSTPDAPTGPATGTNEETLQFNMTGAESIYGHPMDIRFDWGNGVITAWTDADWGATRWTTAGNYEVKVQARCHDHITVMSEWSAATTVTITEPPAETLGTPETPSGPAAGESTEFLNFTTSVVTSSLGHLVGYVFDWGDGTDTSLIYTPYATKQWTVPGTYDVKVKARCSAHPEYESDWSPTTQVTITESVETIRGFYMSPSIQDFAAIGEEVWVGCGASETNLGHDVEYRFDLGDGTISNWAPTMTVYHTWTAEGIYILRGQARCIEHPAVITEWSSDSYAEEIQVYGDVETLLPAVIGPAVPTTRTLLTEYTYSIGSGSNMGHRFEVRMDWGNGEVTDWVAQTYNWNPVYFTYAYLVSGIYEITGQARCIEHPEVITEWSVPTVITVPEVVTQPTLTGDVTGTVGLPVTFQIADAVSYSGHELEYAIGVSVSQYTTPEMQPWTTSTTIEHTFMAPDTYYIYCYARCVIDQTESPRSFPAFVITITY